jgi:hypothetical protein
MLEFSESTEVRVPVRCRQPLQLFQESSFRKGTASEASGNRTTRIRVCLQPYRKSPKNGSGFSRCWQRRSLDSSECREGTALAMPPRAAKNAGFSVCVTTTFRTNRWNRICKTPAPEGRNRLAQDVSPGSSGKPTESQRDGTRSHAHNLGPTGRVSFTPLKVSRHQL